MKAWLLSFLIALPFRAPDAHALDCERSFANILKNLGPKKGQLQFVIIDNKQSNLVMSRGAQDIYSQSNFRNPALIAEEQKRVADFYFQYAESKGIYSPQQVQLFRQVESEIPTKNKKWVAIYDEESKKVLAAVRTVSSTGNQALPMETMLKKRGINFKAAELFKDSPHVKNGGTISEWGRAFRVESADGEEAKKVWDIHLSFSIGQDRWDSKIAFTNGSYAPYFERNYGMKIRRRVFKDQNGEWKLVEQDRVLKTDEPGSEYIFADVEGKQSRETLRDLIMTDPSYWKVLEKYPRLKNQFDYVFWQDIDALSTNPRYREFFERFKPAQ